MCFYSTYEEKYGILGTRANSAGPPLPSPQARAGQPLRTPPRCRQCAGAAGGAGRAPGRGGGGGGGKAARGQAQTWQWSECVAPGGGARWPPVTVLTAAAGPRAAATACGCSGGDRAPPAGQRPGEQPRGSGGGAPPEAAGGAAGGRRRVGAAAPSRRAGSGAGTGTAGCRLTA